MTVGLGKQGIGPGARGGSVTDPTWDRPSGPRWMRLLNRAGGALRRAGVRWPGLEVGSLLAAAQHRTGLGDWGEERFLEGLELLVASFEERDVAHTFGRLYFREQCIRLLVNRLRIQDDLKRHPEILDVPIRRPLVVTGLPRSGTTLLHRLLSEDPSARPLLFWETLEPSPPPTTEARRTDPRIERARRTTRLLFTLAPRMPAIHLYEAESPEECNNLFAHAFAAGMLGFMFDVPRYVEWLGRRDHAADYRYVRRQLQLLGWRCRGDHWVLKSPAHLFALDALLAAFPDACIVQAHRDPIHAIPSACSLAACFRGIVSDRVDLGRLGTEIAEVMAIGLERAIEVRASSDPARFLDVHYPSLVADPIGTIRSLYHAFDYPMTIEFERRMGCWLAQNPQHRQGVHRYRLEQFGLGADEVNGRYAAYRAWAERHLRRAL
jgi:hypothetical protein